MLSPGVYINEIDQSTISPTVSNNVAFFAGNFTKGPIDQPYVITNKRELEQTFGYPTDENYNEWYQCYKFFDYANQLIITRGFETSDTYVSLDNPIEPKEWYDSLFKLEEAPFAGKEAFGITSMTGDGIGDVRIKTIYDNNFQIGDTVDILDANYDGGASALPDGAYTVSVIVDSKTFEIADTTAITGSVVSGTVKNPTGEVLTEVTIRTLDAYDYRYSVGDWVNLGDTALDRFMYIIKEIKTITAQNGLNPRMTEVILVSSSDASVNVATKSIGDYAWIHTIRHLNGGTQAFSRGEFDETKQIPLTTPAVSTQNIDYVDFSLVEANRPDVAPKRAAYGYDLIKNESHWDYLNLQGGANPLLSFSGGDVNSSKLKFFNRTATTESIQIAIGNPEDFIYRDGENYAIAFTDYNGINVDNTYLTNLFYYYPQQGEIAIAIKKGDDIETFVVSFDSQTLDGNGMSSYIENVINERSKYVYVLVNKAVSDLPASYLVADRFGWSQDPQTGELDVGVPNNNHFNINNIQSNGTIWTVTTDRSNYLVQNKMVEISGTTNYNGVYVIDTVDSATNTFTILNVIAQATETTGSAKPDYEEDTWGIYTNTLSCIGGRSPKMSIGSLKNAYDSVADKELFEIDVVIGNEYITEISEYVDNQNPAIDLALKRKDCIAYIGALKSDTVGKKTSEVVQNMLSYILETDNNKRAGSIKPLRTMFAAFFGNYIRIYDNYNKQYRWINVAGDMAGIRCEVSTKRDPWWVSAGTTRGVVKAIDKLAFTPNQAQRDNMYKNGLNPVVSFPVEGILVWGNKTLHPIASSFDRINVRTLFNSLERSSAKAARSQVFEFNDPFTRNAMLSMFNPYLSSVKAGRGIVDFLVVCDETNNTPDVISRNEMRCDIYIKPNMAAEMILLTFTNVGTRSFASVMGA